MGTNPRTKKKFYLDEAAKIGTSEALKILGTSKKGERGLFSKVYKREGFARRIAEEHGKRCNLETDGQNQNKGGRNIFFSSCGITDEPHKKKN